MFNQASPLTIQRLTPGFWLPRREMCTCIADSPDLDVPVPMQPLCFGRYVSPLYACIKMFVCISVFIYNRTRRVKSYPLACLHEKHALTLKSTDALDRAPLTYLLIASECIKVLTYFFFMKKLTFICVIMSRLC